MPLFSSCHVLKAIRSPCGAVTQTRTYILANFWKKEVGTLEIGCDLDYSDREALAFLEGSGGMLPRKI